MLARFLKQARNKEGNAGAENQGTSAQGKDDAGNKLTKNKNKIIFIYPPSIVIIAKDMDTVFC